MTLLFVSRRTLTHGAAMGAMRRSSRLALVFEHVYYGPVLVATMLDADDQPTDDPELASSLVSSLVSSLPGGEWLVTCACPNCGKLREVKSGVH